MPLQRSNSLRIAIFSAIVIIPGISFGQVEDSVSTDSVKIESKPEKKKKEIKEYELYPRKAAFRSAVLPGWGQATNRQIWKLPVVYGLIGASGYFLYTNHTNYVDYRAAYAAASDDDSLTTHPLMTNFPLTTTLKTYRDDYRKQRDLMVILTLGAYALNVIDAYVFAHLMDFDVSDDLTLHVSPTIFSNIAAQPQAGLALKLRF